MIAGVLIALALLLGCAAPPLAPLGEEVDAASLEADEQALWKQSRELQYEIEVSGLLFEEPALDAYLARVLARVTPPDLAAAGLAPRIEVISNVNIDGYSFANGVIYVHTGLLARMTDETQLATLLTRELAHVRHRHALRAKRDARIRADTLAWIGVGTSVIEGGGQAKLLAQAASITSAVGFHHSLETTADETGLALLDAAGYAVGDTPAFYEQNLAYLAEVHAQGVWGWVPFSPPPQITARIAGMKALVATRYPEQVASRPPLRDPAAFARAIHPAMLRQAGLELAAGLFVSAEATARRATAAAPEDATGWILLGRALAGQRTKVLPGRPVPSIRDVRGAYREALAIDPRHADATRELALSFYRPRGGTRSDEGAREALRLLRRYAQLAPGADDLDYVRGYIDELEAQLR